MATLVSTGQITIVDNNDARPITAYITNGSQPLQQVYTKNDSTGVWNPDRTTTNLVLSAKVFVGGTSSSNSIESALSNQRWSYDLATPITTGSGITVVASNGSAPTLTIAANTVVSVNTPNKVIYFEGDYTDPNTGLVSRIVAQTTVSMVQTGTNAVFVQFAGPIQIEQATGQTKSNIEIKAMLIRSSGEDTDNLSYKWFQLVSGSWVQLDQSFSGYATKFGYRTTAQANADNLLAPTGAMLGVAVPTAGAGGDCKGIVINESLIANLGFFRCDITDTVESKTYQGYFNIQDTSDPYTLTLISTAGEKLQNGVGSSDIFPIVYYGATKITDLTGWTFTWYFWSLDIPSGVCYRSAFIDTTRTAQSGGRTLGATPNTAGTSSVITYGGAAITFAAGDIIKIAKADGTVRFYEVASGIGNTVTIRATATTNTWLNNGVLNATPALNEFANGKLYVCTANGTRSSSGANANDMSAKITITGDEIDVKGNIVCEANRP